MDSLAHLFLIDNPREGARLARQADALRLAVYPDLCKPRSALLPLGDLRNEPSSLFADDPREAARPDRVSELDLLDIGVPAGLLDQARELAARIDLCHSGAYPAMEALFCEVVDEPVRVLMDGVNVLPVPALEDEIREFAGRLTWFRMANREAVACG